MYLMVGSPQDILHLSSASHLRDVSYSCGSCGHELNLNSCNRDAWVIGADYGKSVKRGIISFFSIDESRFTQVSESPWIPIPFFTSKQSWGLFRPRTKLVCRKCRSYIGIIKSDSAVWDGISSCKTYDIKLSALQPSSLKGSSG